MKSFTVDAKVFLNRLNTALGVLNQFSKTEQSVGLFADGKSMWLLATLPSSYVLLSLGDCTTTTSQFKIGINPDVFSGVIANRGTVEVTINDNRINIGSRTKQSNYQGKDILTLPFTEDLQKAVTLLERGKKKGLAETKGIELSKAALSQLAAGADACRLTPMTADTTGELMIHVRAQGGALQISCSDNVHMAYYATGKLGIADFNVAMRTSYFDIIKKVSGLFEAPLSLALTDSHVLVTSTNVMVQLPLIQVDERNFDRVRDRVSSIKSDGMHMVTEAKAIADTVACVFGVFEAGARLRCVNVETAKKPTVRFGMKTGHGEILEDLKVNDLKVLKKRPFEMNPLMLEESLKHYSGVVEFGLCVSPPVYMLRQKTDTGSTLVHVGSLL